MNTQTETKKEPYTRSEEWLPKQKDLPIELCFMISSHEYRFEISYVIPSLHSYWWRHYEAEPPSEPTAEEKDWDIAYELVSRTYDHPNYKARKPGVSTRVVDAFDGIQHGRAEGAKSERERLWKLVEKQYHPISPCLQGLRAIFADVSK